jgi:lipopolysaccharide/colanic/teichoic acid biosynthesis glycosyltransferase
LRNGALGFEATPFPEQPSVSAVESSPELGGLAVVGTGAGEAIIDLTVVEGLGQTEDRQPAGLLTARGWQLGMKRAMDIFGSAMLLVVLLPVLLLTALGIRLTSRGSLLYVHERIGKDGKPFRMLKFRSMRRDAHEDRGDVLHLNTATGPVFKIPNDPRITAVGRVIRKLSIDELPQLVNVLKGDMSLVGPRPPLPDEYATYGEREQGRLAVLPGITCIWQVSGRSDVDFNTWVEMDLEYIDTWTLRKDVKILLLTIPAVLSCRGAYLGARGHGPPT